MTDQFRESDEINFGEILAPIFDHLWKILAATTVGALLSIGIALWLPNVYTSEVLLAPNVGESGGQLRSLASQYSGLASLAGIDLNSGGSDKSDLGIKILQSRKFISDFIVRHDVLVPLIAADRWDRESSTLIIDDDDYDVKTGTWVRDVSPPKKTIPTLLEAHEEFLDILSVSRDDETGFISISLSHYSPEFAQQWLESLVQDLNRTVMEKDVSEAQHALEYLNEQVSNTALAGLREVFFRLIEEQSKTIMLANVSTEYLFVTIDPPVVPEKKSSPNRALLVILGTALTFVLSAFAAIVFAGVKKDIPTERSPD